LYAQTPEILSQLSDPFFMSIPCVAINAKKSEAENCFCVDVQPNPIHPAVEHLTKLGHRRIGFITREEKTSNLLEREHSFWNSLKEFGLDTSPELMISTDDTYFESGSKCALKLFSGPDPVSAIICPGPSITFGALYGLMKEGIRIPEDVSLVGYDISDTINPHISTLIQPQYEMAYSAGKILTDRLLKRTVRNAETFQVLFEERGSTGKPNKKFTK
jgi:LacI family transcriptional regulator